MAAAAPKHPRDGLPTKLGRREVIDLGDLAQVVIRRISEGGRGSDTRVVHQDVDWPGFLLHVADEGGDLPRVREIGGMGDATELGCERPDGVLGPSNKRDRGPGRCERTGERLADAS